MYRWPTLCYAKSGHKKLMLLACRRRCFLVCLALHCPRASLFLACIVRMWFVLRKRDFWWHHFTLIGRQTRNTSQSSQALSLCSWIFDSSFSRSSQFRPEREAEWWSKYARQQTRTSTYKHNKPTQTGHLRRQQANFRLNFFFLWELEQQRRPVKTYHFMQHNKLAFVHCLSLT